MPQVILQNVSKKFGNVEALSPSTLEIQKGEFVTLLGPSGSGKTTLLRIVAGLIEPSTGSIEIAGRDVTKVPTRLRGIGMVFQNYALFPHLTVFENIAFGLRERKKPLDEIRKTVDELLRMIGMEGYEQRYPKQLSGGQQQRVAVARALSTNPSVLLMDEPLGALDLKLRQQMQNELKQIQRRLEMTVLYVTHDQSEAFHLSDRIVVMSQGRMIQAGTPEEIYYYPQTRFVADFVGDINLIPATVLSASSDFVDLQLLDLYPTRCRMQQPLQFEEGQKIYCGIRPENIVIPESGAPYLLSARIQERKFLGSTVRLLLHIAGKEPSPVISMTSHPKHVMGLEPGMEIPIGWQEDDLIPLQDEVDSPEWASGKRAS